MPDAWEKMHGLDSNDAADATTIVSERETNSARHQGYSYVEFYLNELADNHVL